jgi:hypothetical protein
VWAAVVWVAAGVVVSSVWVWAAVVWVAAGVVVSSVWVWAAVVWVAAGVVVSSVWVWAAVVWLLGVLTVSWLEHALATTETVKRTATVNCNLLIRKETMQHYFLFDTKKMASGSNSYRKFRKQLWQLL